MKDQPDMKDVNKWVTDTRMTRVIEIAQIVLKLPIKGLSIDSSLRKDDGDIIGDMMLSQIREETGTKLIFTEATKKAIHDAAKTWFLSYLEQEKPV